MAKKLLIILSLISMLAGCASSENKNAYRGAGIGAVVGGGIGALIGKGKGAAIGAALGAGIGGYAGHRMVFFQDLVQFCRLIDRRMRSIIPSSVERGLGFTEFPI